MENVILQDTEDYEKETEDEEETGTEMKKEKSWILEANWRIRSVLFGVQATISTTVVGIWDV